MGIDFTPVVLTFFSLAVFVLFAPAAFMLVRLAATSGLVAGLVVGLVVAGGLVVMGFVVVGLAGVGFVVEVLAVESLGLVVLPVMSSRSDFGVRSSLRVMDGGMHCRASLTNFWAGTLPDGWLYSGIMSFNQLIPVLKPQCHQKLLPPPMKVWSAAILPSTQKLIVHLSDLNLTCPQRHQVEINLECPGRGTAVSNPPPGNAANNPPPGSEASRVSTQQS